jgi:hypothetical protein
MEMPPLRWAVLLHEETGRPINVFVLASPTAAVVYSHRAKTWRVDPEMVAVTSAEDRAEGTGRLRETDRAGAERAAEEFGTTLPSEAEIRQLLALA